MAAIKTIQEQNNDLFNNFVKQSFNIKKFNYKTGQCEWRTPNMKKWDNYFVPQDFKDEGDEDCCNIIREKFTLLASILQNNLPEGRYKALVRTKLEEAAMFATKAFTHRDD